VADGTGNTTSFVDIWRMAVIPEVIKAACSIIGAWGPATNAGQLIQLRALDWGTDGPFQQWPLLTNYHPIDCSFAHSSLGLVGLYGTLTGFSESKLAVSEKVWYSYKGLQNIYGYPWTMMLQDMLRFDVDINAALARLGQSQRTCAIWLGLGQGSHPNPHGSAFADVPADFRLVADSFQELHFYTPESFPTYSGHDYQPGAVWVNKHPQPSSEPCMNDMMNAYHGTLESSMFYQLITALEETGDMHIAVMDFDAGLMFVSNASPATPKASPAYGNGFIQFNMTSLWSTTQQ